MKKFFLLLMAVGAISLVSCSDKAKSSSTSESTEQNEKEEAVNGVKYENEDFGYSAVMPEGFAAQNNDAEMEKERGGKLFLGNGCRIDFTAKKMDYLGDNTPEKSIAQSIEMTKGLNEGAEIKEIDKVTYVSKSQGTDNYAHFECQKNGNKYMIDINYPLDKKEQFDKDVDAVVKSFVVK